MTLFLSTKNSLYWNYRKLHDSKTHKASKARLCISVGIIDFNMVPKHENSITYDNESVGIIDFNMVPKHPREVLNRLLLLESSILTWFQNSGVMVASYSSLLESSILTWFQNLKSTFPAIFSALYRFP